VPPVALIVFGMGKRTKSAETLFAADMTGVENEIARILSAAKRKGLTRDKREALTLQKHAVLAAVPIINRASHAREHRELLQAHRETQRLLTLSQGTEGLSFDQDRLQLPETTDKGTPTH